MDSPLSQYSYLRSLSKPGAFEKFQWYWYSSLLSNPLTHIRNIAGNIANLAYDTAAQTVFAPVFSPFSKDVSAGEALVQFKALRQGFRSGVEKGLFALKHGFTLEDAAAFADRPPDVFNGRSRRTRSVGA